MSRINQLGSKLENLPAVLASFEEEIAAAGPLIEIKGKLLSQCLHEQPAWAIYYNELKCEARALLNLIKSRVDFIRGQLYKTIIEKNPRDLGDRGLTQYVNGRVEYLNIYELQLEVEEIYDKLVEISDAFDKRGFALRDFTSARVAEVQSAVIV